MRITGTTKTAVSGIEAQANGLGEIPGRGLFQVRNVSDMPYPTRTVSLHVPGALIGRERH